VVDDVASSDAADVVAETVMVPIMRQRGFRAG
jgi:hypothetical protein